MVTEVLSMNEKTTNVRIQRRENAPAQEWSNNIIADADCVTDCGKVSVNLLMASVPVSSNVDRNTNGSAAVYLSV